MEHVNLPQWRTANDLDKNAYTICTNEKVSNIKIPINALLCKESNCTIHCKDIDIFYNNIVMGARRNFSRGGGGGKPLGGGAKKNL